MKADLKSLSLQDIVALEKIISTICKKYENIAQMNKVSMNGIERNEYVKAANSLTYFNGVREVVLTEMEKKVNEFDIRP